MPAGVPVHGVVTIAITLRHTFPDDVRLVLQSPAGTAVVLMANAGGDIDIARHELTFPDGGLRSLPDDRPIVTGVYTPTAFGVAPPFPAPSADERLSRRSPRSTASRPAALEPLGLRRSGGDRDRSHRRR